MVVLPFCFYIVQLFLRRLPAAFRAYAPEQQIIAAYCKAMRVGKQFLQMRGRFQFHIKHSPAMQAARVGMNVAAVVKVIRTVRRIDFQKHPALNKLLQVAVNGCAADARVL